MGYVLLEGTEVGTGILVARELGVHWVRLSNQVLLWGIAVSLDELIVKLNEADIEYTVLETRSSGGLYLVGQVGVEFENTWRGVRILINKGRYLVVELLDSESKDLAVRKSRYWQVMPLPIDRVVLDVRQEQQRKSFVWVDDLVATVSIAEYQIFLEQLTGFYTRHSLRSEFDDAVDVVRNELLAMGYNVDVQTISVGSGSSANVIADRQGSGPSPRDLLIVIAHLDSINMVGGVNAAAPGADDNASGSAAILEFARVFSGFSASQDLRLVLFGGEEQGLEGSRQYVASLPMPERERICAVVNMDMIAVRNTSNPTVLLESTVNNSALLDRFVEAASAYTGLIVQTSFNPFGSDHVSFIEENLPALLTIEGADGSNVNVHTENDTLEYIDYGLAIEIIKMNVAACALMLGRVQQATWEKCTVNRAGPAKNGIIYVHMSDTRGRFSSWFQADPGQKKTMLATVLAAMQMGQTIDVQLTSLEPYSTIRRIYTSPGSGHGSIGCIVSLLLLTESPGLVYSDYLLTL